MLVFYAETFVTGEGQLAVGVESPEDDLGVLTEALPRAHLAVRLPQRVLVVLHVDLVNNEAILAGFLTR